MRERSQAITRLCFEAEPRESDLELLGDRERWLLYRNLVRTRLYRVVRSAFPRTVAAMPAGAFDELLGDWLASSPPTTRYFWQVPLEFAAHTERSIPASPPHLPDLFRYEVVCWRVRQKPVVTPETAEFAFDRAPAVNPSLELVSLGHPAHLLDPGAASTPEPTRLCVYRNPKHATEALRLNPVAAALVEDWVAGQRTVADSVRRVTSARGVAIDQGFVEKLGSLIADLLERGVLLGSRA